jgi:hypothetical protein
MAFVRRDGSLDVGYQRNVASCPAKGERDEDGGALCMQKLFEGHHAEGLGSFGSYLPYSTRTRGFIGLHT